MREMIELGAAHVCAVTKEVFRKAYIQCRLKREVLRETSPGLTATLPRGEGNATRSIHNADLL